MIYKISYFYSTLKIKIFKQIRSILSSNNHTYSDSNFDYLFVIGGDGSFIYFFKKYAFDNKRIIGIKSGLISFLSTMNHLDVSRVEGLEYSELPMIQVDIGGKRYYSINDVYISGDLLLDFEVFIDNRFFQHYRSLGFLISTQVGCTALNKSLGGAIVFPSFDSWSFMGIGNQKADNIKILENQIVLSEKVAISVLVRSPYQLYIDGQQVQMNDKGPLKFSLIKSKSKVLKEDLICDQSYLARIKKTFLDE